MTSGQLDRSSETDLPGLDVEHLFQVVLAVVLGDLDALGQVPLVLLVQVVGEVQEDLGLERIGHVGAFDVVQVQRFHFVLHHKVAVSRKERS